MALTHEFIKHRSGYAFGAGAAWVRIYRADENDAPVVVCEEVPGIGGASVDEMSSQLAAEVIKEHFPDGLPNLPVPMMWIEYRPPRRRGRRGKYFLLTFPSYAPRLAAAGFTRRVSLGMPKREPLTPSEVATLVGAA
ncbi:MAG: hypothetical protein H0U65_15680 [Rubrobacter sp.]|jgi:hypothetical protein|nr:hypothetical protein [Rubrobacter sp.]